VFIPGIKLIEMLVVYERYVLYLAMVNLPHRIYSMKWDDFYELGEAWKKADMLFLKVFGQNFLARTEKNHKNWSL
jgi:hypothetical protein